MALYGPPFSFLCVLGLPHVTLIELRVALISYKDYPHVTLVELRLALISYQDYHILEANVWGQWCAGGSGVQGAFAHHNTLLAQIIVPAGGDGLRDEGAAHRSKHGVWESVGCSREQNTWCVGSKRCDVNRSIERK